MHRRNIPRPSKSLRRAMAQQKAVLLLSWAFALVAVSSRASAAIVEHKFNVMCLPPFTTSFPTISNLCLTGFTHQPIWRSYSIRPFSCTTWFVSGGKRDSKEIMPETCDHCSERSCSWPNHSSQGGWHPRHSCLQQVPTQRHYSLVIDLDYRTAFPR